MSSNPAGGMDICLLGLLCLVRQRSRRRADHSSRGGLPILVCPECDREASTGPLEVVTHWGKKSIWNLCLFSRRGSSNFHLRQMGIPFDIEETAHNSTQSDVSNSE
jgi:hypothetical protein